MNSTHRKSKKKGISYNDLHIACGGDFLMLILAITYTFVAAAVVADSAAVATVTIVNKQNNFTK